MLITFTQIKANIKYRRLSSEAQFTYFGLSDRLLKVMQKMTLKTEAGKGRAFVLLHAKGTYSSFVESITELLAAKARVLVLEFRNLTDSNWEALAEEFTALLDQQKVRQASFIGFGDAGVLVQNLCLHNIKRVRTAIYVDSITRSAPTAFSNFIDSLERKLPLGLPLRLSTSGFDGKPFLQRLRCPSLVVTTHQASSYQLAEAHLLTQNLPTSWSVSLGGSNSERQFVEAVFAFQDVPAKCPQKARKKDLQAANSQPSV